MTDERECDQPQQLPNFRSSDPVWSDFKFIRPSGTEWRFFRRISDKVTCRCLSFWPTRRIQCPRESYEINRLPTIRGLASPSAILRFLNESHEWQAMKASLQSARRSHRLQSVTRPCLACSGRRTDSRSNFQVRNADSGGEHGSFS